MYCVNFSVPISNAHVMIQ